jgi:Flp pilus assembly protein TadD
MSDIDPVDPREPVGPVDAAEPTVEPGSAEPAVDVLDAGPLRADPWIAYVTYGLIAAIAVLGTYLAWTVYSAAHEARVQSNSARAVANLAAIVAKSPADAQARIRYAEALQADGRTDEATDQLQTALRLDSSNIQALTDLGLIEMDRRQWSAAEATWLKVQGLIKKNAMALRDERLADVSYYLGTTLVEEGRPNDAITALRASIAIRRDASPVHYMLSVAYQRLHRTSDQRVELVQVLAFDPQHAQANYDLGMLELAASEVATAAELFRISADNAPAGVTDPGAQLAALGSADVRLATALKLRLSQPARALSEARIAAAIDPANARAVELVAGLWDLNGDTPRSINAWRRLLELEPGNANALSALKRLGADVE